MKADDTGELACTQWRNASEAARNAQLRDALQLSHAERWHWLQDAMTRGAQAARARARRGLVTLGPHGDVMWSEVHEQVYVSEGRLISQDEYFRMSGVGQPDGAR